MPGKDEWSVVGYSAAEAFDLFSLLEGTGTGNKINRTGTKTTNSDFDYYLSRIDLPLFRAWVRIHERTISFLGIILKILRIDVFVYNVFKPLLLKGERGGSKIR